MKQLPRIVLKGDRQAAEEMIREGVRQFDILLQQMKFAGLKQDVRRVRYLDGSEIICKSVFGDNTLEIYVPPEVEEKKVIPPPRGKFIVNYNGEGYLMNVKGHRIEMTHVRNAEFPTTGRFNTSVALEDRAIDIGTVTVEHSDYSRTVLEHITARYGEEKAGLETFVQMTFPCGSSEVWYGEWLTFQALVSGSYTVKPLDDWDVVYVAQMHSCKVNPQWVAGKQFGYRCHIGYAVRVSKYVWDEAEYRLDGVVEKVLEYEEPWGPYYMYPTYLLFLDDNLELHFVVCRVSYKPDQFDVWQGDRIVYKEEVLCVETGEFRVVETLSDVSAADAQVSVPAVPTDVYRQKLTPDGDVVTAYSKIDGECSVDGGSDWQTICDKSPDEDPDCWYAHGWDKVWYHREWKASSNYLNVSSKGGSSRDYNWRRWLSPLQMEWTDDRTQSEDYDLEVEDFYLSGYCVVNEASGSLDSHYFEEGYDHYLNGGWWEKTLSGGGGGSCRIELKWPDGTAMLEPGCSEPEVVGETGTWRCEWLWWNTPIGCPDVPEGLAFKNVVRPASYLAPYGTWVPYREIWYDPYSSLWQAFFAVNETRVKLLMTRESSQGPPTGVMVRADDEDVTAAFIKELERVTGEEFNVQLLYGIFAYVRAKDEQRLPG